MEHGGRAEIQGLCGDPPPRHPRDSCEPGNGVHASCARHQHQESKAERKRRQRQNPLFGQSWCYPLGGWRIREDRRLALLPGSDGIPSDTGSSWNCLDPVLRVLGPKQSAFCRWKQWESPGASGISHSFLLPRFLFYLLDSHTAEQWTGLSACPS